MNDNWRKSDARHAPRAPVALEVRYRTTGSFLVSYSLNLSKGGLFLETDQLLPVDTRVTVQFTIPGASSPVQSVATVIWLRARPSESGPMGMGLAFDALDAQIGERIDDIVGGFAGVEVLAVGRDATATDRLARRLSSVLSCAVTSGHSAPAALASVSASIDLVAIDLDSMGMDGMEVIEGVLAQAGPPLLVLAHEPELAKAAAAAGARAVIDNPAPFAAFKETLLALLARPA